MPNYEFTETITVSKDADTRKAKAGVPVNVTFKFNDWTAEDLVNRLAVANSPKVSVQTILRDMKVIPATYIYNVPKAGTRRTADPQAAAQTLSVDQLEKIIAEKKAELAKSNTILRKAQ